MKQEELQKEETATGAQVKYLCDLIKDWSDEQRESLLTAEGKKAWYEISRKRMSEIIESLTTKRDTKKEAPPLFQKRGTPLKVLPPLHETELAIRPESDTGLAVADVTQALAWWHSFQEVKKKLLTIDDYFKEKDKTFIKRSGWRKIAAAFGIQDRILKEWREERGKVITWFVEVEAFTQSGRSAVGVGACSSDEKGYVKREHDTFAIAHTRAKSRAISDLVGGGEVSAEELE